MSAGTRIAGRKTPQSRGESTSFEACRRMVAGNLGRSNSRGEISFALRRTNHNLIWFLPKRVRASSIPVNQIRNKTGRASTLADCGSGCLEVVRGDGTLALGVEAKLTALRGASITRFQVELTGPISGKECASCVASGNTAKAIKLRSQMRYRWAGDLSLETLKKSQTQVSKTSDCQLQTSRPITPRSMSALIQSVTLFISFPLFPVCAQSRRVSSEAREPCVDRLR